MVEYTDQYGKTKEYAEKPKKQGNKPSVISHPKHYNRENAMECIDEMELVFGPEVVAHFCLCNVFKYRYRAGLKDNGYQDLEKSDWYMQKYKEYKDKIKPQYTISANEINLNSILNPVPC